ncbi:hypothetical protein QTJ16_003385 [Diplocarpon rosae]|uniref:AA9 family lytic polysaccharide monooxygenase n=1 Tax=Diplocarpon rosae TaxID=946125 RepID=A0AAD9T290_9HELO|nr:hypothetical protein QTJ16_003385 [Diplocarpon rosae]
MEEILFLLTAPGLLCSVPFIFRPLILVNSANLPIFILSFVDPFVHPFVHSLIHSFTHSSIHSLIHPLAHPSNMKSLAAATVLLASANSVLGHAVWQQLWVDGVDQAGTCVRLPGSNSPVTDPTSQDLACNAGGSTGVAGMCAVTAGQKVTVEMHQHQSRDCAQEAIGGSHHGPVIVYMAAVTDATTADPNAAKWFKVAEEGYDVATKVWADIHVEGTGSASPAGVSFPGAYSATDPGILINIYATIDEYVIPGPELYGAAAVAPAAPAAPATPTASTAAAASSSTVVRAAASSKAPTAPASKSTAAPVATATTPVAADPADECE